MNTTRNLIEVVQESSAKKNFYPTPESVAEELLKDIDLRQYYSILEPSAGKGDLARYVIARRFEQNDTYPLRGGVSHPGRRPKDQWDWEKAFKAVDLECIEIDPVLRNVLEDGGFRVIHDDFLTYETQKRYDLIVMNPPFDAGADHLLKAMDIMRRGGTICCILNAQTLKNPYAYKREVLVKKLAEYNANIRYVSNAFSGAERQTDVEIALITFDIPYAKVDSTIMDEMRKAPTYKTASVAPEVSEMTVYNAIEEWVNKYNYEVACGIRLIEEFQSMKFMLDEGQDRYDKPLLNLTVGAKEGKLDVNEYIRQTRGKYWQRLFNQPVITEKFTSNLLEELRDNVRKLVDYEFTVYNILTIIIKMNGRTIKGVEDTIIALFDKWTASYWHEDSPNRHYYNGWKTNDCFRIGKKVIESFYAYRWGSFDEWRVVEYLEDIEKTLDFLDMGRTEWPFKLRDTIDNAERNGVTKNIETKYFFATFYKKGTCHLTFKNMDLLEKFNMFASQRKGWLPPDYGRKRYSDMSEEEKAVVDSFQGEEKYNEVMARRDYYLDAANNQLLLGGAIPA